MKPPPLVNSAKKPKTATHFYDDTSYMELRTLRKQQRYPNLDAKSLLITGPLAMDHTERKRAPDDPDSESPAAETRPLVAILHSAIAADRDIVNITVDGGDRLRRIAGARNRPPR